MGRGPAIETVERNQEMRRLRAEGMNTVELAERFGVTQQHVSRVTHGATPATLDSSRFLNQWAEDRNRCVCRNPVPGPKCLGQSTCRRCGRKVRS